MIRHIRFVCSEKRREPRLGEGRGVGSEQRRKSLCFGSAEVRNADPLGRPDQARAAVGEEVFLGSEGIRRKLDSPRSSSQRKAGPVDLSAESPQAGNLGPVLLVDGHPNPARIRTSGVAMGGAYRGRPLTMHGRVQLSHKFAKTGHYYREALVHRISAHS